MTANCIIVDDEPLAIDLIKDYLNKFPDFKVIAETDNAIDALKIINRDKPDLIFLDIHLPDISGINIMKSLLNPPKIIFISGDPEYAIDAFEYDVVDYILKPFSIDRFIKALNKYNVIIKNYDEKPILSETINSGNIFKLKLTNKTYNIILDKVIYIESMREYIKIYYTDGTKLVVKYILSKLEEALPEDFIRIHKSFIVSKDKVKSFTIKYVEIADKKIPIGPVYKIQAMKVLTKSILK